MTLPFGGMLNRGPHVLLLHKMLFPTLFKNNHALTGANPSFHQTILVVDAQLFLLHMYTFWVPYKTEVILAGPKIFPYGIALMMSEVIR